MIMKVLVFDSETSGAINGTHGNPFTPDNKLVCVSYFSNSNHEGDVLPIEFGVSPYGDNLRKLKFLVNDSDLLVGFNIKFDLHWIKRYGISFRGKKIWDTQFANFLINHQKNPDPSLDEVSKEMGLGEKINTVKRDFWDKGIDTQNVPWDILYEYSYNDTELTWKIYQEQEKYLRAFPKLRSMIWLGCQDILVTQEMEWNGLRYNLELSRQMGRELSLEIDKITEELNKHSPISLLWDSNDHLSALLYGGIVKKDERVSYPFVCKDGRQIMKERWEVVEYTLPRQINPLPKTEVKKGGYYEVNEKVLRMLTATGQQRKLLNLILKRNKLTKLLGTYFEGIPKICEEYGWENQIVHGTLNHCRAGTGRLASSKPNQQNMDKKVKVCIESRF